MKPPKVKVPPNWKKFVLPFKIGSGRTFKGMRMAFFKRTTDGALVGKIWFGHGIEGPPGHVHGGASAYVLDEAMGCAAWIQNYGVVAKNFHIEFLEMTPIGVDLDVLAKIKSIKGKNVVIEAKIYSAQTGLVYSRTRGIFVRLRQALITKFAHYDKISGFDFSALRYPRR